VTDTDRFNRDAGLPALQVLGVLPGGTARRQLAFQRFGIRVEWTEEPFEWVRPFRFGIARLYRRGPLARLRVLVELLPDHGGTRLVYRTYAQPSGALGWLVIPFGIGVVNRRDFGRVFRRYDRFADRAASPLAVPADVGGRAPARLAPGGRERLAALRRTLSEEVHDATLVEPLVTLLERGTDEVVDRVRPYVLADEHDFARRRMLDLHMRATRAGLLDMQWDLMCPLCRGVKDSANRLQDLAGQVHCDVCQIDFGASFDRAVELTFHPTRAIRSVEVGTFCVGGPGVTPHIVVQQLLSPGEGRQVAPLLDIGRYRMRLLGEPGDVTIEVAADGPLATTLVVSDDGWSTADVRLGQAPRITIENRTTSERLIVLERMAWTDQAASMADVTSLHVFRDLFSHEVLRPGERVAVGNLTVLFTDLRDSTRFYRDAGDAPAFGRVLDHFAVLKEAIEAAEGAVVKTIGDAVMATFPRPAPAVQALLEVQRRLASPPPGTPILRLKAGVHAGACLVVTLNDRLDYFGSTVNLASRLERYSTGHDVVVSDTVYDDPEVQELLGDPARDLLAEPIEVQIKGLEDRSMRLWRVGYATTLVEGLRDAHEQ